MLNRDKAGVVHCWSETQLLRAWGHAVQVEASGKVRHLFPNMTEPIVQAAISVVVVDAVDPTNTEDPEAGHAGVAFTETENDEEWVGVGGLVGG